LTLLTETTTTVDAPHAAVMWTVKQVAERDQISKQAVSKRARRYADEHALIVERDAQDRIVKLNVVQYDQLRGQFGDPAKAQGPKPKAERKPPAEDSLDEARRRQAWIDAERSRLALDEAKGRVVSVDAVSAAIAEAAELVATIVDRLPNAADALAPEVAKTGAHGLRLGLTQEAHRMRDEIAKALAAALLPSATPEDAAPPVTP
jgi:hypothetical protein